MELNTVGPDPALDHLHVTPKEEAPHPLTQAELLQLKQLMSLPDV
jgi:hypothetical protein